MKNRYLLFAAYSSFLAAVLHLGCIIFGAPWYRFFGAGEHMASMAEAGKFEPTLTTLLIATALSTWGLFALSGAGVIRQLPFLRTVIFLVAMVFIGRGIAFPFIMPLFPENTLTFWLVSSFICLTIGLCYALGGWQLYKQQSDL
ncbi:hypothetical protein [Pseudoalteromonas luteoviolacea]|uniref:Uncharacterized protein n=1 Tax=Pseudoalteromonas luteoviolacea S4054 TaxID=1129367 RepID=A0A0F6AC59_9GAMM|nr:hypothetical protein [Pseudoalteromonas luteoviolacea]AOT08600.1 hypothetical protein S4054249_12385 [Pseudoalteromonas luteoviolacea]AOT13516.1 hypothetical protein S40542_12360 [Pseudoalteromonas luteoviolacea]AOT18429.1 hypothetical protein S4054_12360 [Pseudoalteromonas luteoviolacea]KKE83401.1 hypothetical protein N479_13605 [Pseudoalteromonas luteoviolacea S4054]KZN75838.1 hypothetical protein N481_05700 [Pseudoalteromonas luteoviolacea S4047-1]